MHQVPGTCQPPLCQSSPACTLDTVALKSGGVCAVILDPSLEWLHLNFLTSKNVTSCNVVSLLI